jgi:hypothetical protein
MSRDPIVDEVRAIRDAIAREHNYDVDAIFHMLREREATSGRPHVTLPPRLSQAETPTGRADAAQQGAAERRSPDGGTR